MADAKVALTVKDVIEQLSVFPDERQVYLNDAEYGHVPCVSVEGDLFQYHGPAVVVLR